MKITRFCLIAALVSLHGALALAQGNLPARITVVSQNAAGDSIDAVARALGEGLKQRTQQTVIVDNRPGANGAIAALACKNAAADGSTYCILTQNVITLNPLLTRNLPYDPVKDFEPVSLLVMQRHALILNNTIPARNLQELVEYSKKNPGKLNYASLGIGSGAHMVLEWLKRETGGNWTHVPYKGGAQALTALVAGEVHLFLTTVGTGGLLSRVQKGEIRALLARGEERNPLLPDVPSFAEAGLKLEATPWTGMFAPAGTPRETLARFAADLREIITTPAFREKFLTPMGFAAVGAGPEEFRSFIARDFPAQKRLFDISGIKPE